MAKEQNHNGIKKEMKEEPVADIAPFDPTKKKKKKKDVTQEPLEESVENLSVSEDSSTGLKKKKKRAVQSEIFNEDKENSGVDFEDEAGGEIQGERKNPWEGSERDYTYLELIGCVSNKLHKNNPEVGGERRRNVLILRPPQVLREGTKKTVFVNLMDHCKTMHRQAEHVMSFLLAEMGTTGSLDGQQRLVIKGRFAPKNLEGILRRYSNEYVICSGCKSPDTILSKEQRLVFLRCENCGSGRSVAQIKAGFVARVGHRNSRAN